MSPESESDVLPLHQSAIIRMEGIEPSTFGLSDRRSDLLSYIREVIVGFEPTITVLQTVVLTTWRYDPNVAYRTRTYNRKIRNLLHYPIMLMPHSRCNRIRTCIRRFWRPLHIHHAPHLWNLKRRRRDLNPHALTDHGFQDRCNTVLHHDGKTRLVGLEPTSSGIKILCYTI